MSNFRIFVGSSQRNVAVARAFKQALEKEECVEEVQVWDEGAFDLNCGILETLLRKCEEYDFAIFVFAADDMTTSKEQTRPSPRDNVLFESGLFMGALGSSRVFIVCDEAAELKIPSDFAGVMLASYDGSLIESDPAQAVADGCCRIRDHITSTHFPDLVGEWRSIYHKSDEEGQPLVEEDVEVTSCGKEKITIHTRKGNREDDYYTARGRMTQAGQIRGEWRSRADSCSTSGIFILMVHTSSTYMFGYFTTPNEEGGPTYAGWALAKKTGASQEQINERLKKARNKLMGTISLAALTSQP